MHPEGDSDPTGNRTQFSGTVGIHVSGNCGGKMPDVPRSDIYAVGAVLYEMVSKHPYAGNSGRS